MILVPGMVLPYTSYMAVLAFSFFCSILVSIVRKNIYFKLSIKSLGRPKDFMLNLK